MELEFAVETWADAHGEMENYWPLHWKEIALHKDKIKLEVNHAGYEALEALRILHLITARDEGLLVGYNVFFVSPHLHYASSITAVNDVLYLFPPYRVGWNGYKFLKFARDSLIERGCERIVMNMKLDHMFGPVLKRLGFNRSEEIWQWVR